MPSPAPVSRPIGPSPKRNALSEKNFGPPEYRRNTWVAFPDAGVPLETVIDPKYWVHVIRRLRPCDIIEVHAEDGAYFARLYVRAASANGAVVMKVLEHHTWSEAVAEVPSAYMVLWRGGIRKWGVKRISDEHVMKDGFDTKELAHAYVGELMRQFAA